LIWTTLKDITGKLESYLADKQLGARTITLKLRYSDFTLITRSQTHKQAILTAQEMCEVLPELLKKTEVGKRPIRLLGVTLAKLESTQAQQEPVTDSELQSSQLGLF